ncbi:ATP-binding protein [Candidatus Methylospira mobilis]|uniref:ATP-binding protein n=1 Tax=Candidatus Methylospira mobilis TaxID=1808979 RepID=UPI0028EBB9D3|nr:ATP-binding protein [Candidatus Methylospira mobilis]WNV03433.1 ATP-binding protein [Candidatus Methylospira mobilis]
MHLKIWHKLFIVFVLLALVVLGLTAGLMHWSFRQGFLDYLNDMERTHLTGMARRVAQAYDPDSGWGNLVDNPGAWLRILRPGSGRPPPGPDGFPPPPAPFSERDVPPPDTLRIGPRIGLFDANRRFVAGNPEALTNIKKMEPVQYAEMTVGYLGIMPMIEITDRVDLRFVERQNQAWFLIVALVLTLALLAALIVARNRTRFFRKMAEIARQLADGYYDMRIPVTTGDELGELATDFNALADALSKSRDARQRWFADISHELRTPLTILYGELQALEDGVRPFDESTLLSLVAEVQRLRKLVDDLYQLALTDQGALNYRKYTVNVVELVQDVADSFSVRLARQQLTLEVESPAKAIEVSADADRLAQLFVNLMENSARYTDAQGLIQISIECDGRQALIIVQDSAPGVPDEALPRLFERLYRVEASRSRDHGGSGLGLAICQNITEAHGGSIAVSASALGGLKVEVRLPVLASTQTFFEAVHDF